MRRIFTCGLVCLMNVSWGQFMPTELVHKDLSAFNASGESNYFADLNNDGYEDVLFVDWGIAVRYSNGYELTEPIWLSSELCWSWFAQTQDLDQNGFLDILVRDGYILNFGNNNFSELIPFGVYGDLRSVNDFNGDGYLDILIRIYNSTNNGIAVLENDGLGYFELQSNVLASGTVEEIADFNADGYTDLAEYEGIFLNDGFGEFGLPDTIVSMSFYNDDNTSADTNQDGYSELIYIDEYNELNTLEYHNYGWEHYQYSAPDFYSLENPEIMDFNNDGIADIICGEYLDGPIYAVVYLGVGNGVYNDEFIFLSHENDNNTTTFLGFFNMYNDGAAYAFEIDRDSIYYSFYANGALQERVVVEGIHTKDYTLPVLFDVNNDGLVDIMAVNSDGTEVILMNDQQGGFELPVATNLPNTDCKDPCMVDLNNDGFVDIIFATTNSIYWLQNFQGNYFFNAELLTQIDHISKIELADIDQDNDFDLIYSKSNGSLCYMHNNSNLEFLNEVVLCDSIQGPFLLNSVNTEFSVDSFSQDSFPDILYFRRFAINWFPNAEILNDIFFIENNTGIFQMPFSIVDTDTSSNLYYAHQLSTGDFNNDGNLDVANISLHLTIYLGDGAGNFEMNEYPFYNQGGSPSEAANIDTDENLEFIFASLYTSDLLLVEMDSTNQIFTDSIAGTNANFARFVDFNNDGLADLLFTLPPEVDHEIHISDGFGNWLEFGAISIPYLFRDEQIFQLDIDNDADNDLIWVNHVGILVARANGHELSSIGVSVYVDENQNGINDNEPLLPFAPISVSPPSATYYTHIDGNLNIAKTEGEYLFHCILPSQLWLNSGITHDTISVSESTQFLQTTFGLKPNGINGDVSTSYHALNSLCTDTIMGNFYISNSGNIRGIVRMTMHIDNNCGFISSIPEPVEITGDSITWQIDSIGFQEFRTIEVLFLYPGIDALGESIQHFISIETFHQGNQVFNESFYIDQVIQCGYDPNDITEANGYTDQGFILDDGELEYTIRFQNTGNAPTRDVRIENQLSELLQWNTLQPIAWSHDFELMIDETGRAIFTFNEINLPDSVNNEGESHGFITYRIHPVAGLTPMAAIENTASIFFDLNPPVVTNTTTNTIYDCTDLHQATASSTEVCTGEQITFANNATWIENLTWTFNGTQVGIGDYAHTLNENGTMVMHAHNALCDYSQSWNLVADGTTASFTTNGNLLSANDASAYQWLLNGNEIVGATSQNFTISETGNYAVMITDANGCTATSAALQAIYTGIDELKANAMSIYPNPATSKITITVSNEMIGSELKITNELGQIVLNLGKMKVLNTVVDCSHFAEGIYTINVATSSTRLVIE